MKKVNEFYKTTEKEFLERGDIWIKQLQILLDLKRVLAERRRRNVSYMGSGFFSRSNSSSGRNSDYSGELLCLFDTLQIVVNIMGLIILL